MNSFCFSWHTLLGLETSRGIRQLYHKLCQKMRSSLCQDSMGYFYFVLYYYYLFVYLLIFICSHCLLYLLENDVHKSDSKSIKTISCHLCCYSCMIFLTPVFPSVIFFSCCAVTDLHYRVLLMLLFLVLLYTEYQIQPKQLILIKRVVFVL